MKNKALMIISGGVCLLFAVFSGCGGNPGEKEYNRAMASWKENDLVRAQSQLEKAIRKLSGNETRSVANNQLGLILWQLGKPDEAIERFGESCRLAEDLTGANLNLGAALYQAGRLEQAEFELTKILNETPENATARIFMGLVHMDRQDWQDAARELTAGLRVRPNDPAGQNALALTELHLNRSTDTAVKRLTQLLVAYPDYAPAAYNLALIHDRWLNDGKSALGWYRQYLEKAGEQAEQSTAAAQAIARLEGQAAEAAEEPPPSSPDPQAAAQYIAEGIKLHKAKKYRDAVEQYTLAIQADGKMRITTSRSATTS